jgi:DinB superfamily
MMPTAPSTTATIDKASATAETHCLRARASAAPAVISEEESSRAAAPGKWTPKQIIGHLIDSACNNHSRFVRAQFSDELYFPGYRQEEWVAVQRYDTASWSDLLALWRCYNLHIARIVAVMPEIEIHKARPRHTLDPGSWRPSWRTTR